MLLLLAILCAATPMALFLGSGAKDEADMLDWIARQPLDRLMTMRALLLSGVLFLIAAVFWPR